MPTTNKIININDNFTTFHKLLKIIYFKFRNWRDILQYDAADILPLHKLAAKYKIDIKSSLQNKIILSKFTTKLYIINRKLNIDVPTSTLANNYIKLSIGELKNIDYAALDLDFWKTFFAIPTLSFDIVWNYCFSRVSSDKLTEIYQFARFDTNLCGLNAINTLINYVNNKYTDLFNIMAMLKLCISLQVIKTNNIDNNTLREFSNNILNPTNIKLLSQIANEETRLNKNTTLDTEKLEASRINSNIDRDVNKSQTDGDVIYEANSSENKVSISNIINNDTQPNSE